MPGSERDWERRLGARLKLRDLHILSTVVQWGSMAKAATHLAMSQPAVSEAIANLEAALKVRLLDRNVRGVEPTIYATALLKRERAVFDELQLGIKEIASLANPTAGEVRLATTEVLACGLVPHVIARLARRYPEISIHAIVSDPTTLEFRELRERRVDILLARVPEVALDEDIDLDIFHEDLHFVVVGAQSPWARRRKVTLAELLDEPWVFPYAKVVRELITAAFRAHGLPLPRERVTSGTLHLQKHLLATGGFLTITSSSVLQYNADAWAVKPLPIDLRIKPRPHAILKLKNRTLSPVVQLFIDELKAAVHGADAPSPKAVGRRS